MRVIVNGAAGIVGELKRSHEREIEELQKEIDEQKSELRKATQERIEKQVEQILAVAQKDAQREYQRRVARARSECEANVLDVKKQQVEELRKAAKSADDKIIVRVLQDIWK